MKHTLPMLSLFALTGLNALAGTPAAPPPPPPAEESPFVTGTLSLTLDTHFVSFGQDVWAAGNDWDDFLFHPSLELNFNFGDGWSGVLGTWWDVNDNASTNIGTYIQEIDIWAGVSKTSGNWKTTLLYHNWMYASQNEQAVELKVGYNGFYGLNPSLLLHYRFDDGIAFDTGLVTVLGIAPGTKAGPVSLSFPVQVAFDTDGYHGGESGFSFASAGVNASVPLCKNVTFNAGVTYYYTNEDVIPGNPDEDFFTGSTGITVSF